MDSTDKASFWQDHIAAWQASGLSQIAYCEQQQLKLTTFTYWRHKQSRRSRTFIPVTVATPSSVAVSLPGGVRIELPAGQLEAALPMILRIVRDHA